MLANNFKSEDFRSARGIGTAAVVVLCGLTLTAVLNIIVSAVMFLKPGVTIPLDDGQQLDVGLAFVGLIAIFELGMRFGCAIIFLIWLNRAYKNLPVIGAAYLEFTPGWAVAWWFIPFANLLKPYQVVKELYSASHQAAEPAGGTNTGDVTLWWVSFIAAGLTLRVSDALIDKGGTVPDLFPVAYLVGHVIFAIAAVFCIFIIRRVNTWQELAMTRVGAPASADPPPPPTFEVNEA